MNVSHRWHEFRKRRRGYSLVVSLTCHLVIVTYASDLLDSLGHLWRMQQRVICTIPKVEQLRLLVSVTPVVSSLGLK